MTSYPGCSSRLRAGDRVAALTVWGAYAERVCVPKVNAVEEPGELDPAEVVGLVLTYMTAYQLLRRMTKVKSGGRRPCMVRLAGWTPRSLNWELWPGFARRDLFSARPCRG